MLGLALALSALAMSPQEAVSAAVARAPMLDVADARVLEAEARLHEVRGGMYPTLSIRGSMVAQNLVEVDMTEKIDLPFEIDSEPITVQPGLQLQVGASLFQPIVAPQAWLGRDAAKAAVGVAEAERDADAVRIARRTLEAWHQAALAHAILDDARRTEELATRLAEKGDALLRLGAVSEADVLPFRRAVASARATTALAEEAVVTADGVLRTLTGLDGVADVPTVPGAPLPVEELIASMQRPDVVAAEQRAAAAEDRVGVERAGLYPTMGLTADAGTLTPPGDFLEPITWRVGLGANIPIFQGGRVGARVDGAAAVAQQAEAGERVVREAAEIEIRMAHGALASALATLVEQEEAVRLARDTTAAAERRVDQGGGTLLDLQQAQLEQYGAEFRLTRARSEAAMAADLLALAVKGSL